MAVCFKQVTKGGDQYMEKFKRGIQGMWKKYRKQARILVYRALCVCAITVLHEQWMCHLVQWTLGRVPQVLMKTRL